ncbi:unnamed protein product [Aureobasidium uvarum]|uniref:Uncharacterized protein n=1 Tax=Aureobasidium uvarum TaxID=2773716 RepID=A0A9N8KSD3_9PEZI|nr:unnamed protein product [Aureobasidium uvarum]
MTSPSAALMQSIRSGTTHFHTMSPKDRVKLVGIMGYCTLAFSAPFAGAAEMSRRTRDDTTYAKILIGRPLSYRDCLAYGSRLEDYAGLGRKS